MRSILCVMSSICFLVVGCSKKSGGSKKDGDPIPVEKSTDKVDDPKPEDPITSAFSGALNLIFGDPNVAPPALLTANSATVTGAPTQDVDTRGQFNNALPGPMKKSVTSTSQILQFGQEDSTHSALDEPLGCNVSGTVTHAAPLGWTDGSLMTCANYEDGVHPRIDVT